ncbi:Emp24/gp25L/p24 family protein [Teladorsagia circumcincta]|uniref:Emp24/gp25L/p24 family protein n=1 Tax=Teladorsagia circumcincta TaxID=45464 RepID=A0A2G9ULJ5_TELCI|nr:Emp24/gp25L/p24 family protein [Teladorsagia circumcincta]
MSPVVRVPTHEDGTCLFWEFATDYYDIGFGVYFEWTIADSNQVSIHVSESDDEDEYDEATAEGVEAGAPPPAPAVGDVESGGPQRRIRDPSKPKQDEIIPVYRRDCHEEVGPCLLQIFPYNSAYRESDEICDYAGVCWKPQLSWKRGVSSEIRQFVFTLAIEDPLLPCVLQ